MAASFDVRVDDSQAKRAMEALFARTLNLREPFEEIGASLVTSTQQRFEDEETPAGEPWPELSDAYQKGPKSPGAKARRGGEHILRVKHHLVDSITHMATPTELSIGSNRKYAAIHQLGGTDDMAPGPAAIPARPFLGLSAADESEITAILLEHLGEAIQ